MNNAFRCIAVSLALASIPRAAPAETLAEAIALAYQDNPALQAQRAQLRAQYEPYVQAQAGWRPTAGLTLSSTYSKAQVLVGPGRHVNLESNSGAGALTLNQPLYTGGQTTAAVRATLHTVEAARETLRAVEESVILSAIQAYLDVRLNQTALQVREKEVNILQSQVDDAHARQVSGELTLTDVNQSRTWLAQARAALSLQQGQLQISRAAYVAAVGRNPAELAEPPPLPGLPATVDQAFDVAESESPALRAAELTEAASRARIAEARAGNFPTVNLQASLGYTGQVSPFVARDYDRAASVGVVLTQPLLTGGVNASRIREAIQTNESDRITIETGRRAVVEAVAQAWNGVASNKASAISDAQMVELGRTTFSEMLEEYRAGQRSTLDVLYAEQNLRDAQLTLAQADHDQYLAQATLLQAMGRLEAARLVADQPLYDERKAFRKVAHAGAPIWQPLIAAIDSLGPGPGGPEVIPEPAPPADFPRLQPAINQIEPDSPPALTSPTTPLPQSHLPTQR